MTDGNTMDPTKGSPGNPTENRELTFGEKLVGINFNPSNDDKVSKAKRLCAELADLMHDEIFKSNFEKSPMHYDLYQHAAGEILNAQMNVVKVLTFK